MLLVDLVDGPNSKALLQNSELQYGSEKDMFGSNWFMTSGALNMFNSEPLETAASVARILCEHSVQVWHSKVCSGTSNCNPFPKILKPLNWSQKCINISTLLNHGFWGFIIRWEKVRNSIHMLIHPADIITVNEYSPRVFCDEGFFWCWPRRAYKFVMVHGACPSQEQA